MLAIAAVTIAVQLDRQAAMSPELAPLVPGPMRSSAQLHIAAAAVDSDDVAQAVEEARFLLRRRPVPAEHLSLFALAQSKADMAEEAAMSIRFAAQRGWREPVAQ